MLSSLAAVRRNGLGWCTRGQHSRYLSYPPEPLDKPIAGLRGEDHVIHPPVLKKDFLQECRITTLDNGLRVASQEAFGQYSTVGGECWSMEGIRPFTIQRPI